MKPHPLMQVLLPIVIAGMARGASTAASGPAHEPRDVTQLWAGYDPRAAPLDVELLREWEEHGARLQRLYFTSEVADGVPVRVFALAGVPKGAEAVPGILHLHGGGQTASPEWIRYWTTRGYAAVSIDMCGEWAGRTDVTRWGPARANMKDGRQRTSRPADSLWYHWAVAARRALTLLERLPGVDPDRLGVFGVSMGGQVTWMVAGTDNRVRTAVPIYACGWNTYPDVHSGGGFHHPVPPDIDLWRATMEPETYARYIRCPVLALSATNDFHASMDRYYDSLARVDAPTRVSFTPRYDHHLEPPQGRTLEYWMDRQLRSGSSCPDAPVVTLVPQEGRLDFRVTCSQPAEVRQVEVFASCGSHRPQARFWRSLQPVREPDVWRGQVPLVCTDRSVRVFANVTYRPGLTLSSNLALVEPSQLAGLTPTERPVALIDDFADGVSDWTFGPAYTDPLFDWTYLARDPGPEGFPGALGLNPAAWAGGAVSFRFGTHKVNDPKHAPPDGAQLRWRFRSDPRSELAVHVLFDHWGPASREYVARVDLRQDGAWQEITVAPGDCVARDGGRLADFRGVHRIDFVGTSPNGRTPAVADVRWLHDTSGPESRGSQ